MAFDEPQIIIGHRGAAGLMPENTLPGFVRAQRCGVHAVELDVHLCHGQLCVIHDETLDRTTNASGKLSNWNLTDLRALDAGDGAAIPFLEEVFDCLADQVGVNVELKGKATALPLAKFLQDYSERDVLVSSFNHQALFEFREAAAPHIPVAPLFSRWSNDACKVAVDLNAKFINLSHRIVNGRRLQEIGRNGFRSLVYTVNDLLQARRLLSSGVAGIFTDYPDRITLAALNDSNPSQADTSHP